MNSKSNQSLPFGVYIRVSTMGQADKGTSLENQEAIGRAKAAQMQLDVYRVYSDAGVSGALYQSRADLQDALRDMEAGKIGGIIIANFSRYSRDEEHQAAIKKRVKRAGGQLVFCDFDYQDTPEGNLQFGVFGAFAAYERRSIEKRTKDGKRRLAMNDVQPMRAYQPYGLRVITKSDVLRGDASAEMLGKYVIVEVEAAQVRRMYADYSAGASLGELVARLNRDEVPVPRPDASHRRRTGWNKTTVSHMLAHPIYKGEARYGYWRANTDESRLLEGKSITYQTPSVDTAITVACPAIVDAALWNSVQGRLKDNKLHATGQTTKRYLLSTLVQCAFCGQICIADNGRPSRRTGSDSNHGVYPAYHCACSTPSAARDREKNLCSRTRFDMDRLDGMVSAAVAWILRQPEYLASVITGAQEADLARREAASGDSLKALHQEETTLKRQAEVLIEAQMRAILAGVSSDVYEEKLVQLSDKRRKIAARIGEITQEDGTSMLPSATQAERICRALSVADKLLTDPRINASERNRILRGVVAKVVPLGGASPGEPLARLGREARERGEQRPDQCWVVLRDVYSEAVEGRSVLVNSVSM